MSTSSSFVAPPVPECSYSPRMTRAAALALRTAGALDPNCTVVITDGPTIGTAGNTSATEIELQPQSATDLGMAALVHTTFHASAWAGVYDIDLGTGTVVHLEDHKGNIVDDPTGTNIQTAFPWHNANVTRNLVSDSSVLTNWGGIPVAGVITNNRIFNGATVSFATAPATMNLTGNVFDGGSFTTFGGNVTVTRSSFTGTTVSRTAGGSTGSQILNFVDSTFQGGSVSNSIGGSYIFTRCTARNLTFAVTSNRGITFTDCEFMGATVNQNRTNVNQTDAVVGLNITGGSTLTLSGGADPGVVQTFNNTTISNGSTVTMADPVGSNPLSRATVTDGSTATLSSNGTLVASRIAAGSTLVAAGFPTSASILEFAGTTTSTGANTNRLKNVGFTNWV